MDLKFSQDTIDNIQEFSNSIFYILCIPYSENLYAYSINSVDNFHYIERQELDYILFKISNSYFRVQFLTTHFRKFLYIKENNSFRELDEVYDVKNIEDMSKLELQKQINKPKESNPLKNILNSIKTDLFKF